MADVIVFHHAQGLTSGEAMRVFRRACRSANGLGVDAVGGIVRDKRRALRRTPAPSFHDDDTPLGIVGHWYPWGWPETEVGWVLFDSAHEGKGYATEAARRCVTHAWDALGWDTAVSYIAKDNLASVRVAERLGATLDADAAAPNPDKPCLVYRHPRPEGAT